MSRPDVEHIARAHLDHPAIIHGAVAHPEITIPTCSTMQLFAPLATPRAPTISIPVDT